MMKGVPYLVTVALLALASTLAFADDPSPLQDFCVAINKTEGIYTLLFLLVVALLYSFGLISSVLILC